MFNVKKFFDFFIGKKVAFIGLGESHLPLLSMFKNCGANVIACDKRSEAELSDKISYLKELGIKLNLGESYLENIDADIIFRTPGMKFHDPFLEDARKKGIVVTSEMEVFFDLCPCKIIGITGSDGKTTTTTIISEILKRAGKKVFVGGNIGKPLLPEIKNISPGDIVVVELSSFQLISMRRSPDISVVTNVSPNHLDMHKDMTEYINSKKNILLHQNAFSKVILNFDNEITRNFSEMARGKVCFFSRENRLDNGAFVDMNGDIFFSSNGKTNFIMNKNQIRIPGEHNVENYLAAVCAVSDLVDSNIILKVAKEFNGVEHRIEFVREVDGVKFFNDSIASSPNRVIKGILSLYDQKIILICGGYDKKIPFDLLGSKIVEKVKILILMGQTAGAIESAVKSSSEFKDTLPQIIRVENMGQAVMSAKKNAISGDIVALSPACASFDLYKNFDERGKDFKNWVNSI